MEAPAKFDEWEARHWTELQALYHLAADAPSGQRTRLLQAATADEGLVQRVLNLLEMDSEDEFANADDRLQAHAIDERVGPYRLVRLLGSGGLGAVYLAERLHGGAIRQYALKVLSLHAIGPEMQTRFLREQQLLALLQHANIPRMLDAGFTDTGRPYLVMEYIDGEAITTHCDATAMTVQDRVRLMLQVCEAVAYAHRTLVVHLDLKPQNILVSTDGQAKLLDFGTSKLLESELALTTTVLATPAYASPEQLRNEPITTACDVYGLGAVLYELLCGSRPWGNSSPTLILEHALREDEPPPFKDSLSEDNAQARGEATVKALRQRLQGDVQSIVARCLRSRAASRYGTVDELAQDLRRYLDGLPVAARKQTVWYRTVKFVRRHRIPVYSAALATMLVFSSLVYAAVRQHQALVAAHRAVQMQQFMARLFELANTHYTGQPAATVPDFLRLGAKVLPALIQNAEDQTAARLSLGESMLNDGSYADARALLTQVSEEASRSGDIATEALAESEAGTAAYRLGDVAAGNSLTAHANALTRSKKLPLLIRLKVLEAFSMQRYEKSALSETELAEFRATVLEARGASTVPEYELAGALLALAQAEDTSSNLTEQQQFAADALHIYESEAWAVCGVAEASSTLGYLRQQSNDLRGSEAMFRTALAGYETCKGPDARDTLEEAGYLALAMVPVKHTREAIPLLEKTIPRLKKVVGADPMQLRGPLLALARSYLAEGQFKKSEQTAAELNTIVQGRVNPASSQTGAFQSVWARALAAQGKYTEALAHAEIADRAYAEAAGLQPAARDNAALIHAFLLDLRAKQAKPQAIRVPPGHR